MVTGPNGSGKSTLVKLLMGIETPDAGEILLDGKDISKLSIAERAGAGIGYAFQQPPRFKGMTIRKLLSLAAGEPLNEENAVPCCQAWAYAPANTLTARRTIRYRAAK